MAVSRQRAKVFASTRQSFKETGFRGKLEAAVSGSLAAQGCQYLYEPVRLPFNEPRNYIPDFALTDQAIFLEAKGWFPPEDRRKLLLVKAQYPDLDIRLVFDNPNTRIGKKSQTDYGRWCAKHGFPYAERAVPPEWVAHRPNQKQKEAFAFVMQAARLVAPSAAALTPVGQGGRNG